MKWTADITNDPTNDFELVVDIPYDGSHRATILKKDGELVLRWYPDEHAADVPVVWLAGILARAQSEL